MASIPQTTRWLLLSALGLSFTLASSSARAQAVPMGDHTAGRGSDTGHEEAVNATGGYSASVPLDLPRTRSGLAIPLSILSGGHQVGAAGSGWDVPLSYMRIDDSIAKRKPRDVLDAYPSAPPRVTMSIAGATTEFVHQPSTGNAAAYVGRRDGESWTAIREANDWTVRDGQGHAYIFIDETGSGSIGISLLRTITSATGTEMALDYDVRSIDVPGSTATVVNLTSISYNYASSLGCAKDEIDLSYIFEPSPLSYSTIGGHLYARDRYLDTVTVESRTSCVGATTLRTYKLDYQDDPVTHIAFLHDVKMYGREGTAEASTPITLGTYGYNAGIDPNGLSWAGAGTKAAFPAGADSTKISGETKLSTSTDDTTRYNTAQNLVDVTGDGVSDLVFAQNGVLWSAKGIVSTTGMTFGAPAVLGDNGVTIVDSLEDRSVYHGKQDDDPYDLEQVWKAAVDMNGDGRIDIVDAWSQPGQWIVYVNTPSPGPSGVAWKKAAIDLSPLLQRLRQFRSTDDGRIPLMQRYSATTFTTDGNGNPVNTGAPSSSSFVEWKLVDINGDGFPDFTFNTQAAHFVDSPVGGYTDDVLHTPTLGDGTTNVEVMFDDGGIVMDALQPTWTQSIAIVDGTGCGVEQWTTSADGSRLGCTFADVTGDGIPERISGNTATIGRGNGFGDVHATIDLPDSTSWYVTPYGPDCANDPHDLAPTSMQRVLRDVTGDGIPDIVRKDPQYHRLSVWVGTGAGFTPEIPVVNPTISEQLEGCHGSSFTYAGMYDIDGDGRVEVVTVTGDGTLSIIEPTVAGADVPDGTGLLSSIDNGYGATTRISYRSAKTDHYTAHQIPVPEIVVGETWVANGSKNGTLHTQYAYGDATQIFDGAAGKFTFPGYARTARVQLDGPIIPFGLPAKVGQGTITERNGLADFVPGTSKAARYARNELVGRVAAVTSVAGVLALDPDAMLAVDTTNDTRIVSRTTYDYESRLFEEEATHGESLLDCLEYVYPYDYEASLAYVNDNYDLCSAHGFTVPTGTRIVRGSPTTNANVTTSTQMAVDDYGRPTTIHYLNDVVRGDDDLCVDLSYAAPASTTLPVLDAVATRKTWGCSKDPVTYGFDTYQYDGYPSGSVTAGFVTSQTSERHSADNGALFAPTIRMFDASYDANGNLVSLVSVRDDGALRQTTNTYDPFGMVETSSTISASALPSYVTTTGYDLVSLQPTSTTDPNGTTRGTTYDGFGRSVTETVAPPGGTAGVLSSTVYLGFTDASGRRIQTTTYDDPIDPAAVGTAAGHQTTTFIDLLGRAIRRETVLGASYAGQTLVTGETMFDDLGRVSFQAGARMASESPKTAHGVARYYNPDGTPYCAVEADGKQAVTAVTDVASGVYATCWYHGYANNAETFGVSAPDANQPGAPQAGTLKLTTVTAIGRLLSESTSQGGAAIDYSSFTEDRLGNVTSQSRFLGPATPTGAVTTAWHYDSFGNVVGKQEPEGALQSKAYDSWGEPTVAAWTDAGTQHASLSTYDALGRMVHREETNAGVTDDDSVSDYVYDAPSIVGPEVTPTYVFGRLSKATTSTGSVSYSYDAFGNANAQTHVDEDGTRYVQKTATHANGTVATLDFYLPDTGYEQERVSYDYDSASRMHSVTYDRAGSVGLYKALQIDGLGHVLTASYGAATYQANYDASGRRYQREALVTSPAGRRDTRLEAYDAVGRELDRFDLGAPAGDREITSSYDALGRVHASQALNGTTTTASWLYTYDALGNVLSAKDGVGTAGASFVYRAVDKDEPCRIDYPTLAGSTCNVTHDGMGNVLTMPERGGGKRALSYYDSGLPKSVGDKRGSASFRYDAFGALRALDVSGIVGNQRHDRHYGANIEVHADAGRAAVIARNIPGAGGLVASLRGPSNEWVFAFGDGKGTRFTVDLQGNFLQDLSYQPFGEETESGVGLSSPLYSSNQWNDGDALDLLGVVHLGARLYDPVIGRFLGRDPVTLTHSSNAGNPYAFAENDPVGGSDPRGTCDPEDVGCAILNPGSTPGPGYGGPSGGGGGGSHGDPYSIAPRGAQVDPWNVTSFTGDLDLWKLHGTMQTLAYFADHAGGRQAVQAATNGVRLMRQHPVLTGIVLGGVALLAAAPVILPALGFVGGTEAATIGVTVGTGAMVAGPGDIGNEIGEVGDELMMLDQGAQAAEEAPPPPFEFMIRPENVNPTGCMTNCVNVTATVNSIAKFGYPASAIPTTHGVDVEELPTAFDTTYQEFDTLYEARNFVEQGANGSRAIVVGMPFDPSLAHAHAFSMINYANSVEIYDQQAYINNFEGWYRYRVMFQK